MRTIRPRLGSEDADLDEIVNFWLIKKEVYNINVFQLKNTGFLISLELAC